MSNPFAHMLTDTVYVEDAAGNRAGPYKTAVGEGKSGEREADIFEDALDVEEGFKLIRKLPNGKEEVFTVLDAHYQRGLRGIPSFWQLKLGKASSQAAKSKGHTTNISISNSHGIQIGDHNVQNIANSLMGLIEEVEASTAPEAQRNEAKDTIRTLLTNPIVAAVLGGTASGLLSLLGQTL